VMRAVIVAAIDQDTLNAGFAHLTKRDLLGRPMPMIALIKPGVKR
jgi:hypothetical protein